jgi:hypothetical protein
VEISFQAANESPGPDNLICSRKKGLPPLMAFFPGQGGRAMATASNLICFVKKGLPPLMAFFLARASEQSRLCRSDGNVIGVFWPGRSISTNVATEN